MADPARYDPNGKARFRSNPLNSEIIHQISKAISADMKRDTSTFTGPNHIPVIATN